MSVQWQTRWRFRIDTNDLQPISSRAVDRGQHPVVAASLFLRFESKCIIGPVKLSQHHSRPVLVHFNTLSTFSQVINELRLTTRGAWSAQILLLKRSFDCTLVYCRQYIVRDVGPLIICI